MSPFQFAPNTPKVGEVVRFAVLEEGWPRPDGDRKFTTYPLDEALIVETTVVSRIGRAGGGVRLTLAEGLYRYLDQTGDSWQAFGDGFGLWGKQIQIL